MDLLDYLKKQFRKGEDKKTLEMHEDESFARNKRMLSLEPRIVFDAAGATEFVDTTADSGQDSQNDSQAEETADPAQIQNDPKEILIVDSRIGDYSNLLPSDSEFIEVFVLNDQQDGISQISQILGSQENITGLHILSHGSQGAIELAGQQIHSDNLSDFSQQLESWSDSLTSDADILLYGCEVGSDNEGIDFLNNLSELTGADIAASDDLTGSDALNGDWVLEQQTGEIETEVFVDFEQAEYFDFVLSSEPEASDIDFKTGSWSNGTDSSITNTIDGVDVTVTTPGKPVGQGADGVGASDHRVSFNESIEIHFSKNGENIDVLLDQVDITNLFKTNVYSADNQPLKMMIETVDGNSFEYYFEAEDDQVSGTDGDKIVDLDIMAHKISIEVVRNYIHFSVEGLSFIENPTPAQVNETSEVQQAIDFRDIYKWGESSESYQEHFSRTQNGVEVSVTSSLAASWVYQRGITIHNVDGLGIKGGDSYLYIDQEEFMEIEFNKNGTLSPVNVDQIDLRQMNFNGSDNDAGKIIVTTIDGTEHEILFESNSDDIAKQKIVDINIDGVTSLKFVTDTAGSEFTVQRIVFTDDYSLPEDHYAGKDIQLDLRDQFWTTNGSTDSVQQTVADLVDVTLSSSEPSITFGSTYGAGIDGTTNGLIGQSQELYVEFSKDGVNTDVQINDINLSQFTTGEVSKIIIEDSTGAQTTIDVTASTNDSHETVPINLVGQKITVIADGGVAERFGLSGVNFQTLIAEPVSLTLNDVSTSEDQNVELNIELDLPSSPTTSLDKIIIENVPTDSTLSAGTSLGNGAWEVTENELESLVFTPAENFSGDITLTIKATTVSGFDVNEISQNLTITVNAEADSFNLVAQDVTGTEDHSVALEIDISLNDESETIQSIQIENVPETASLNQGTDLGNGVWSLSESDLDSLEYIPGDDVNGQVTLTLKVVNSDENGDQNEQSVDFNVSIASVNDIPVVSTSSIDLPDIYEDTQTHQNILISDLVTQSGTDIETGQMGIALSSLDTDIGQWYYAENPGDSFQEIPSLGESEVFLLGHEAQLSFIPEANAHGTTSIDFHLWDLDTGSESTVTNLNLLENNNSISQDIVSAEKNVISVNDVVDIENNIQLELINAKEPNTGQQISEFIQDHITNDIEQDFGGIAIIEDLSTSSEGQWEFSQDGGQTWQAIENPSATEPVILEQTDFIRFAFNNSFDGEAGNITIKAWDGDASSPSLSENAVEINVEVDNPQFEGVFLFEDNTIIKSSDFTLPTIEKTSFPTISETIAQSNQETLSLSLFLNNLAQDETENSDNQYSIELTDLDLENTSAQNVEQVTADLNTQIFNLIEFENTENDALEDEDKDMTNCLSTSCSLIMDNVNKNSGSLGLKSKLVKR